MSIRRRSRLAVVAFLVVCGDALAAPQPGAPAPSSQEEPLEKYRERFKEGMDRYRAGELAEAIGYWEPIFRELGEQKGYRLAYNLGVAYAELGDATRAAERLQVFVTQVDARRSRGEGLATIVQKEEADARARIAGLVATKGRIQIDATPPRAVQIDANEPRLSGFVAWVSPGEHTVTFAPGTLDMQAKHVTVRAGDSIEVTPAQPATAPSAPTAPLPSTAAVGRPPPSAEPPLSSPLLMRRETEHPFSPALFAVSGGLAIAAAIAAVPLESHAWDLRDRLAAQQQGGPIGAGDRQSFDDARSWAYGAVGAGIALGALTAALAAWYFFGTSQREVVVTPASVGGRF
jgi:hypothetical protein